VLEVLLSAAAAGRRFHVVVLDSRPELEGRQMLRRLLQVSSVCVLEFLHSVWPSLWSAMETVFGPERVTLFFFGGGGVRHCMPFG
jgi:hypothetical protein